MLISFRLVWRMTINDRGPEFGGGRINRGAVVGRISALSATCLEPGTLSP